MHTIFAKHILFRFYSGCISDVRYSDEAWPMDEGEESESVVVETLQDAVDGCESDACSGVICPAPQECEDYWRMPQCV